MSYRYSKTDHPFRRQVGLELRSRVPSLGATFVGVIDQVGISAQVAFGTRKLRAAYAGSALRVRRSSDNAELDIGFTASGDLNTTALLAHTGAGQGYVVTWYDQSGNGRDVTQATALAQPLIVSAGSLQTIGTRGAAVFDGVSTFLARASFTQEFGSVNAVAKANALAGATTIVRQEATVSGATWFLRYNGTIYQHAKSPTVPTGAGTPGTTNPHVISAICSNGTNSQLWEDGTSVYTGTAMATGTTNGIMRIGASPAGGELLSGLVGELVVFDVNLTTTQRQTLERNQGTYFGITVA